MKNQEIAEIFERMGILNEMKGENVFKVRAYHKAAETIAGLGEDIESVKQESRLKDIPGIGDALQEKIAEYLETGRMAAYDRLVQEIPESILDIVDIPSVGPKKAKMFFDRMGIKDVAGLKRAASDGRLLTLPGIKAKTVQNILDGIKIVAEGQERMDLATATRIADDVTAALKKVASPKKLSVAGSLRRGKETVRDIDLLIQTAHPERVMDAFVRLPQVRKVNAHGETKSSVMIGDNVQVDLRIVEPECFGAALLYFTGSKNFNVKLRQVAKDRGLKVNEYGIFGVKGGREIRLAGNTEKDCFGVLGLPLIPPELREDIGEQVIFGGQGHLKIPRLVGLQDIKGDLHVHSTWSDGRNTIEDIARAAIARGYTYIAVSDHSLRLKVARGLTEKELLAKKKEIDRLNNKYRALRILYATEVEIDPDGRLDYNDRVLKEFDLVIAGIHSGFEQDAARLTRRIVGACQNRYVHVIAHPTGMQRGRREAYAVDLKEICQVAAETNTHLEVNAFPVRMDLNSANTYFAKGHGVRFAINTDAHAVEHLDFMRFGVAVARRGWLTKGDVLNTLEVKDLLKAIKK